MKVHQVRAFARPMAAVVLATASCAVFASSDGPASGNNGAMTFANVKVVNAPVAASATGATGSPGMRAQKDKDTGELRAPTASEVAELDARARTRVTSPVALRMLSDGTQAATLNEDFMSYEVVRKDANGKLVPQCVTGESAADHALHAKLGAQEVQNDR